MMFSSKRQLWESMERSLTTKNMPGALEQIKTRLKEYGHKCRSQFERSRTTNVNNPMIHDVGPNDVNGAHTSIWSYDYGCYIQVPSEI